MKMITATLSAIKKSGVLLRATAWATVLGIIEMVSSARGRRFLAICALGAAIAGFAWADPIRTVGPGEMGIRVNRISGGFVSLSEGWAWQLPGIHRIRTYPQRDQVYRPVRSASATGAAPFQSLEGLAIGVDVVIRYAVYPSALERLALHLPEDAVGQLIQPTVDGVLHRTFARHSVRQIFSSHRNQIETQLGDELRALLRPDGVLVRDLFLGNIDLPADYKSGLEALLSEELASEKMQYTLELKEKKIQESALEARADKARREESALAAAREQIIAAQARAEAMKHVLPLKEKEIQQRRLEAEAAKVQRIKDAEASAAARRIEADGESDSRRKLADAEVYRLDLLAESNTRKLESESRLIAANPLLIQKTLADKLGDQIQVIIAPPEAGGFFASGLLGGGPRK